MCCMITNLHQVERKQTHDKKKRQVIQLVSRCSASMTDIISSLNDIEENYNQLKSCFDILFPDFSAPVDSPVAVATATNTTIATDTTEDDTDYGDITWEDEELPEISFEDTLAIAGITQSYALVIHSLYDGIM